MTPLEYLYSRINYERVSPESDTGAFRLQRMRHLLRALDHPERSMQIVHVGGTKGKGSTCHMIASMLVAGGKSVGLYTSPHLERLEERFRVQGEACDADQLSRLVSVVRVAAEKVEAMGEGVPTFFELTTAMAFEHFRSCKCEIAIVEVGLGGRLDSTNVCDPVVTVLTSVGLDHQHILGDTLEEIAGEKAGIIKPGVQVVSGVREDAARNVIERTARQRGAPLWQIGIDFECVGHGKTFDLTSHQSAIAVRTGWQAGAIGLHQQQNACVALAVLDALNATGASVPLQDQRRGLADVVCPGRIEIFSGAPEILLDTAHNVDSVKALRAVLRDRPARDKCVVVFGTSADKDAKAMLHLLQDVADHFILTRYWSNPRWFDPAELDRMIAHSDSDVILQPADALRQACAKAGPHGQVVICGSFFLAAELLPLLRSRPWGDSGAG